MSEKGDSGVEKLALLDLPNEILISVLYTFTTLPLLHIRCVCHRFQNLILRILHNRLLLAASLEDRKLILECYHPSAQYSEPYLRCDYLGTAGLSNSVPGNGPIFQDLNSGGGPILMKLYSHFRPTRRDPQFTKRNPHPAGEVPGSRTSDAAEDFEKTQEADESVTRIVNLDAHENFSQLVFNTNLVQLGPRRGVFLDIMTVNDKKTLRIFRDWLAEQARRTQNSKPANEGRSTAPMSTLQQERGDSLVWIDDAKKTAGLRIRVEERKQRHGMPILLHRDEEQAVSYSLELQELQISTIHLLLAIEQSIFQEEQHSGKALVFTTFRNP